MPEEIRADLLLGRDTLSPGLVKAGQAASDASSNVRQLTRDLYEAGKVRATPVVDLNDDDAKTKLEDITLQLKELGKKAASPDVNLKDKEAKASMLAFQVKLDALGRKVASPRITLDGVNRAEAQLFGLGVQLDRLQKKFPVSGGGFFGAIRHPFGGGGGSGLFGLFGGSASAGGSAGGSAASAGGQAGGGLLAALGPTGSAIGIGAAITAAATLLPSLLPLTLGLGVGGGAVGLGAALGSKANQQLQQLGQQLAGITGHTKADKQKIAAIQSQMASIRQANAGPLGVFGALTDVGHQALGVFSGALTARGPAAIGPGGRPIAGSGAPSFLTGLTGIFKQLGGFIKTLGPQLADLFRASLPFLQTFVKFLEQAAKVLLPVFTQMLQQMTPILPLMSKGLLTIVQGLAAFLKEIGPQAMQASAKIFVAAAIAMEYVLKGLGIAINWLVEHVPVWVHNIAAWWDRLRANTVTAFDSTRRFIMTYAHDVIAIFDALSRAAGDAWNILWDGIKQATRDGIGLVTGWFGGFSGKIKAVFKDSLSWLYDAGKNVLQGLWNGLLFVWHKVTGFISSIANWIKQHKGPVSLDSSLLEPAGRALMGGLLKGLTGGFGAVASFVGGVAGRIGSAIGSGGVTAAQGIALKMLPGFGWSTSQFGALDALWNRESGWRWNATNPTSGAYGIPQALPPGKMAAAGPDWRTNPATQILWGLNYIKSRYGSPAGAWGHELAFGWYDKGGFLPPGLSLAYNATGRPEQVIAHGGAGQTVNVYVNVGHGTHPVAAAQEIAKVLNVGARNGVRLRTSILGPG